MSARADEILRAIDELHPLDREHVCGCLGGSLAFEDADTITLADVDSDELLAEIGDRYAVHYDEDDIVAFCKRIVASERKAKRDRAAES